VLAVLEIVRGHTDRAAARWNQLAATGVDGASDAQLGLADLAMYEGRFAEAVKLLEDGSTADFARKATDAAALKLVTLAHAQTVLGQADAARSALGRALDASHGFAIQLWATRGYVELGDFAQARALEKLLASQVGQQQRMSALLIEGEILLATGNAQGAIDQLKAAQRILNTWLGHLDLARAYIAASAFPQASTEVDIVLAGLPEGSSALIDEQPTAYLLPQAYYYKARALEGLGSPEAARAYRRFLAVEHAEPAVDPLVLDAQKRLPAR
jgi:tetratricopeptide (TPR) repeat protein